MLHFKNNKLILSLAVIVLGFLALFLVNLKLALPAAVHKSNGDTKIILIDPGHGGIDGGAVSRSGTLEKNINLSISKKLKESLEEKGYKAILTREDDRGLNSDSGTIRNKKREDLANRNKMKKDTNCDMFISIHLNMFPQSQYYGAQVWYAQNDDSRIFAKQIQENLINDLNNGNKRVEKPALNDYVVLRDSTMPAVIVECGFLSNPGEEAKLKTDEYQGKIADSITKSVNEYFEGKSKQ